MAASTVCRYPVRMRRRPALTLLIALLLCMTLVLHSGCRRDFTTEADSLRERVMMLEREVESLQRANAELRAQLSRSVRQHEDVSEEALAATPQVVGISIGRMSHARIARDASEPDKLRIYINPIDGRGRFVPLVGTLRIHAAIMPDGDVDPVTIARTELSPEQVRDAYRSGFTGTHYTVHLPVDRPAEIDTETIRIQPIIVRVIYHDAHTGEQHSTERSLTWRAGR